MADEWTINMLKEWNFSSYEAVFKGNFIFHRSVVFNSSQEFFYTSLFINSGTLAILSHFRKYLVEKLRRIFKNVF